MSSLPIVRTIPVHPSCAAAIACCLALTATACGSGSGAAADAPDAAVDVETADSGPEASGSTADGPAPSEASSPVDAADAGISADSAPDAATLVTVSGHVVAFPTFGLFPGPQATPIAGRRVTLLDAGGKKLQAVTDSSGAFQVSGVALPYDALVEAPQAAPGAISVPAAFLALGTAHPRLIGEADPGDGGAPQADGGAPAWRQATLDVPFQFSSCPAAVCDVQMLFVDHLSGASLGGGTSSYSNQHTTFTWPWVMQWYGAPTGTADVYVLVYDQALSSYWYAAYPVAVPVQDKGTSQMPVTVAPSPVATIGTFTLTVTANDVPSGWGAPNLNVSLTIPGTQQVAQIAGVQSTSVAMQVPNLLGATLDVQAWIQHDDPSNPRSYTGATVNGLPLTTGTETITLLPPITVTSPAYGATVSASKGALLSWTGGPKTGVFFASFVAIGDAGATGVAPYVLTSGNSIDLARLTALGLTLTQGPTVVGVDCMGEGASLDAVLDESTLAVPDGEETMGTEWRLVVGP